MNKWKNKGGKKEYRRGKERERKRNEEKDKDGREGRSECGITCLLAHSLRKTEQGQSFPGENYS